MLREDKQINFLFPASRQLSFPQIPEQKFSHQPIQKIRMEPKILYSSYLLEAEEAELPDNCDIREVTKRQFEERKVNSCLHRIHKEGRRKFAGFLNKFMIYFLINLIERIIWAKSIKTVNKI